MPVVSKMCLGMIPFLGVIRCFYLLLENLGYLGDQAAVITVISLDLFAIIALDIEKLSKIQNFQNRLTYLNTVLPGFMEGTISMELEREI